MAREIGLKDLEMDRALGAPGAEGEDEEMELGGDLLAQIEALMDDPGLSEEAAGHLQKAADSLASAEDEDYAEEDEGEDYAEEEFPPAEDEGEEEDEGELF